FFFQAEDGIRDGHVTGVQTCALPISGQDQRASSVLEMLKRRMFADKRQTDFATMMDGLGAKFPHSQSILEFWAGIHNELNRESRSEERRVGKECRCGRRTEH